MERDLAILEEQIFIIQLETSPGGLSCPDLHSQQVSYHLEAPSSEAELLGLYSHLGWRTAKGGLASVEEQIFIIQLETSPGGLSCLDLPFQPIS